MITREVSISTPDYEVENLRYLTVQSTHLKGRGDITVFVPPGNEKTSNLPVAILLHGVYGSHWAWTRQMNVHNETLKLIELGELEPMVLVMPSDGLKGGGSGYVAQGGFDFEKWIVEDVIAAIQSNIPQVSIKSKLFITGLSMGGYGALRIGAKYQSIFNAFSGHSSVTNLEDLRLFIDDGPDFDATKEKEANSVLDTILSNKKCLSPFRFDCGSEDELVASNRKVHLKLKELEIPHIYEEFSGGHTADYWKEHILKSLLFFNKLSS
jgi:putative tributyrin esterase